MKLITQIARLLDRRGGHQGTQILDDVIELYRERCRERGRSYALTRAAWDIVTLSVRPSPPARVLPLPHRRTMMARLLDDATHALRSIVMSSMRNMDTIVGAALARPRFMGWIMSVFAVVALIVAALGVYGMVAYGVARRTREIGVRMALGATRGRIVWMIGRQTLLTTAAGVVAGLGGALWLSQSMRSMLFGVAPFDVQTYAIVTMILVMTVLLAIVVPARRAVSVDPLVALRVD